MFSQRKFPYAFKMIFWDFDGVIKDSVAIKTQAFLQLFESYGAHVLDKVKSHHEANGGMSRFDKLPLYLQWAGEIPNSQRVNQFCKRFSQLCLQGVINAPWVPGVENYLRNNPNRQMFILVSATPQEELEQILQALNIKDCFLSILGAPLSKNEAIHIMLERYALNPQECLMIGDARADLEAAESNHIFFLLRRHTTNTNVFVDYKGPTIKDFKEL